MSDQEYSHLTKRAARKKRADKKRNLYKGLIVCKIKERMESKFAAGFSRRASFNDGLAEADIEINQLIKSFPHDAHLIRQSAYMLKRDLENALKGT